MFTSTFRAIGFTALALLFFIPEPALAHNAFGDMGNLTNGFLHPLTTIPHLLLLVSLGIVFLLHSKVPEHGISGILLGSLLGFSLASFTAEQEWKTLIIVFLAFLTSMLVVSGVMLNKTALFIQSLLVGFFVGIDTEFPLVTVGEFAKAFLGLGFGTTLLAALFFNLGGLIQKDWQRIALRIISSWIATISILYGAFWLIGNA
jgi:hydrogenase/urease accessory protein HupE